MKTCSCGGMLLRHAVNYYLTDTSVIGLRYKCQECKKTFTVRVNNDEIKGSLFFNSTGRPNKKDWRYVGKD